jgi:hypothetical protein
MSERTDHRRNPRVTDAAIEKGAIALFHSKGWAGTPRPWEEMSEQTKDHHRDDAYVVLNAARLQVLADHGRVDHV